MLSILLQLTLLSLCVLSLFVRESKTSLTLLVVGICSSRLGLWVFDMSVTQLMQELVPEEIRGVMGSMQHSLNKTFELLSYLAGIVYSDVEQFHVLIYIGYGAVAVAAIIQACGVYFNVRVPHS